jgi:hypothetical protein
MWWWLAAAVLLLSGDAGAVSLRTSQATSLALSDPFTDFVKGLGATMEKTMNDCYNPLTFNAGKCINDVAVQPFGRQADTFAALTQLDRVNGYKTLQAGYKYTGDYLDQQLQKDIVWLAKIVADQVCHNEFVESAVVITGATALSAAVCAATNGLGPGCAPPGMDWMAVIKKSVGEAVFAMMLKCILFQFMQQVAPTLCAGVTWSISSTIADLTVQDPYTPAIRAIIQCSCGQCPYQCSTVVVRSFVARFALTYS